MQRSRRRTLYCILRREKNESSYADPVEADCHLSTGGVAYFFIVFLQGPVGTGICRRNGFYRRDADIDRQGCKASGI